MGVDDRGADRKYFQPYGGGALTAAPTGTGGWSDGHSGKTTDVEERGPKGDTTIFFVGLHVQATGKGYVVGMDAAEKRRRAGGGGLKHADGPKNLFAVWAKINTASGSVGGGEAVTVAPKTNDFPHGVSAVLGTKNGCHVTLRGGGAGHQKQ